MSGKCEVLKLKILRIIAVAGEVEAHDFIMLGYTREHTQKTIKKLADDGLIKKYKVEKHTLLRLTNIGKKFLMDNFPNMYDGLFEGTSRTNKIRTEKQRRLRNLRLGKLLIIFNRAGVKIFPGERLGYNIKSSVGISGETVSTGISDANAPEFYNFSEIKKSSEHYKTCRSTRSLGVIVTDRTIYIVYYTGDELMKWHENTESSYYYYIKGEFSVRNAERTIKRLYIAESGFVAEKILKSSGGKSNQYLRLNEDGTEKIFAVSDTHIDLILKIMCDSELYEELYDILMEKIDTDIAKGQEYDGVDIEGRPTVCLILFDLRKADRLYNSLKRNGKKGHIICFDFQKEYIEEYFKDLVYIETIKEKKVREAIEE